MDYGLASLLPSSSMTTAATWDSLKAAAEGHHRYPAMETLGALVKLESRGYYPKMKVKEGRTCFRLLGLLEGI